MVTHTAHNKHSKKLMWFDERGISHVLQCITRAVPISVDIARLGFIIKVYGGKTQFRFVNVF